MNPKKRKEERWKGVSRLESDELLRFGVLILNNLIYINRVETPLNYYYYYYYYA